jgi:hypothetical protein
MGASDGGTEKWAVCSHADSEVMRTFRLTTSNAPGKSSRWSRPMSVVDYLRNSEQAIYDFNTPWSMAIVVLGFVSAWLVTNILEHLGLTRHVWHLPLFFAAQARVANLEANLLQKRQDLDRETDLFQRNVDSKQLFQNAQNAYEQKNPGAEI